jgi:hypothetical protein
MTDPNPVGIRRRRRGLAQKRELRELAADAQPLPRALDLVHVTSVGAGREIVSLGQIEATRCAVFQRDLVYMFLARSAYRLRNGNAKWDQINRFPCVFVIRPDELGPPFHIYPFDTGAATSGYYGDTVDPHVYLEDYELDPNLPGRAETYRLGIRRQPPVFQRRSHPWAHRRPARVAVGRTKLADNRGISRNGQQPAGQKGLGDRSRVFKTFAFEGLCSFSDLSAAAHRRRSREE